MGTDTRTSFNTEDWWAVWIGLAVVVLGLSDSLLGIDLLGWVADTRVYSNLFDAVAPTSAEFGGFPAILSLIFTYAFVTVVTAIGAASLRLNIKKYVAGFSLIFWLTYICWVAGHWAYIAATPDKQAKFGIDWSLSLTGEAGYIIALVAGLIVGNVFPKLAKYLEEAARPEWFVKIAIVILGASVGLKAFQSSKLAGTIIFRGLCAIVEAYLIYWPVVYFVSRKWFKLSPEWSAPLASGISICGVSAAMATAGAIKARPVVPVIISSLVIVFAVVELLIIPFAAQHWLYTEPMMAGAWMGLAIKTDGAAAASGAITDALIRAKAMSAQNIVYEEGWMLATSVTTKMFIDIFIGIWAFVLAMVWVYGVEKKPGVKVPKIEIWYRFPKFVIGYILAFLIVAGIGLASPPLVSAIKSGISEADNLRKIFFALTFFSIGSISNFAALKREGMGKLAVVYFLCLFGFIIWVGLLISFLFFHGITPPIIQAPPGA
ncbi:MAG: putative sulfate exporter family transporter [Candidatus Abyssobacteria bacterium SURF_5]|uniref:Putative sulfate exporter family transporter n=1 Tax=Abyssobacteria bacterium (strain SURF_5) TaxID=2093360 RepID=A0A3A4NK75_ABYX5|nr:MAG: putative sulfate exporter family transporter [Candidatus Abyssubacteria bacterium SURF_5]